LKWNNIPHEVINVISAGPKNKAPYIEFNGSVITDSTVILDHLSKFFHINMDSKFTAKELSVSRAFRIMFEEHLYFCLTYFRWVSPEGWKIAKHDFFEKLPTILKLLGIPEKARQNVLKLTWYQGMGRHSQEEVMEFAKRDIKAFSDFLGDKPYALGEFPCSDDFGIWAILDSLLTPSCPQEIHSFIKSWDNLPRYHERFSALFNNKKTN